MSFYYCNSDWLRTGRSGVRIPVGATFYAPVQTRPGVHPASNTMGTGCFPGVKRPGRDLDHQPPTSAEVKERVELFIYSHCGSLWPVPGRTSFHYPTVSGSISVKFHKLARPPGSYY